MNDSKKTVEVDGVSVEIDTEVFDDFDLVECIADSENPDATDAQRLSATVRLFRLLFGPEYARVKRELRAAHDGRLTVEVMTDFASGVFEAVGAKN